MSVSTKSVYTVSGLIHSITDQNACSVDHDSLKTCLQHSHSLQPTKLALDMATQIFGIAQQHSHCHAPQKVRRKWATPSQRKQSSSTTLVSSPDRADSQGAREEFGVWGRDYHHTRPHSPTFLWVDTGKVVTSNPNSLLL